MRLFKLWLFCNPSGAFIVVLVLSHPFYVHGEESDYARASSVRQVLSLAMPPDVQLWDWVWEGTTIVSSEGNSGVRVIEILDFSSGTLESTTSSPSQQGEFPVLIGDGRLAYIRNGRELVLATVSDPAPSERVDLGDDFGLIGEMTFAAEVLWLYAIEGHTQTPNPRMYAVYLAPLRVVRVGEGYYPRTFDGSVLHFIDHKREFSLYSIALVDGAVSGAAPNLVCGSHVYSPAVVSGTSRLVVQTGSKNPRIDLITSDGQVIRCLSGEGRSGMHPRVSGSGKYVAFAHREDGDYRATVLEVVDMDGRVEYQALIGSHPIGAAYRWSRDGDRLAVVGRSGMEPTTLDVVSFGG